MFTVVKALAEDTKHPVRLQVVIFRRRPAYPSPFSSNFESISKKTDP